jgi:hypothetical protein
VPDEIIHSTIAENDSGLRARLEIHDTSGGTLVVSPPGGAEGRYDVVFQSCASPICWCRNVDLVCVPHDEPDRVSGERVISLDVDERSASPADEGASPADTALARAVATGLADEQWQRLSTMLYAAKRRGMMEMDLDDLDVEFPAAVVSEGVLVAYGEVFPSAESFTIAIDGQDWVVDDQYCVQPHCRCSEAILCFVLLPPGSTTGAPPGDARLQPTLSTAVAVCYDLLHRHWKLEDDPPASLETARVLVTALEDGCPKLVATLTERRRQLRYLFAKWLAGQKPPRAKAAPKVGRNDPCPCGSGKKLKRCCGRG